MIGLVEHGLAGSARSSISFPARGARGLSPARGRFLNTCVRVRAATRTLLPFPEGPPSPRPFTPRTSPAPQGAGFCPSMSCTRPCAGRRGACPRAQRARSAATRGPARSGWGVAGLERSVCTSRNLSGALARRVIGLGRRGIKLGRRGPWGPRPTLVWPWPAELLSSSPFTWRNINQLMRTRWRPTHTL